MPPVVEPSYAVELPQGRLGVHDLTVGEAAADAPVVVLLHAITANALSWRVVADEIDRRHGSGRVRVLAPDLRGRATSRDAGAPYGLARHAEDVLLLTSVFGAVPVLVGHSMGAFVAARAAAAGGPDRLRGLVLVDGGLALDAPPHLDVDAALHAVIGPALARLSMRFADPAAYTAFWAEHPAVGPLLAGAHGAAVAAHLRHDLVEATDGSGGWVSSCVLEAVRADGRDLLLDEAGMGATATVAATGVPVELVWAGRGLLGEPPGLYDPERLGTLAPPGLRLTAVPTASHDGIIVDEAGVSAVVDAVDAVLASTR